MPYSVAEAAKAIGKSKATVFRAIRNGTVSATRDDTTGAFMIDPAELHRVFPRASEALHDALHATADDTPRNAAWRDLKSRLELTELRLSDTQDQVADLRHRLDQADADRRQALDRLAAAQERIAALLTDQRARSDSLSDLEAPARPHRSWWGSDSATEKLDSSKMNRFGRR
jgi:septal ring factor EnvC (AmiA/AmiB activator)